jgi:hypothetical protein
MMAARSGGGFLDFGRTGSIRKALPDADNIGTLLKDPPADVVSSELADPFGVYNGNPDVGN